MRTAEHHQGTEWVLHHCPKIPTVPGLREAGRCIQYHALPWVNPHLHDHQRLEICLMEKGQHQETLNGKSYVLHKGEGLVVRPGDSHGNRHASREPSKFSFLILDASADGGGFLGSRGAEARRIRKTLFDIEHPFFAFTPLATELWLEIMNSIERLDQSPADPPSVWAIRLYLAALCSALLESSRQHARLHPFTLSERVDKFVDANLDRRASVTELSQALRMSESCFQARFKKEAGLTPINYVLRRKMNLAKEHLAKSDKPVTTIALDLGFSSSQNFATAFKRFAGWTPSQYRLDMNNAGDPATHQSGT